MMPERLAELHARAMAFAPPWSARAFAETLASPAVFFASLPPSSLGEHSVGGPQGRGQNRLDGFVLGRVVADEAELLTLAVVPGLQRRGLGRSLLSAFETEAAARGATTAFLEVAVDNAPALALYDRSGWREAARRKAYYSRASGASADAVVMRKTIGR